MAYVKRMEAKEVFAIRSRPGKIGFFTLFYKMW